MKQTLNIAKSVMAFALLLALGVMFSDAALAQQKGTGTPKGNGQYFVDQDGDGICDNFGSRTGQKMGGGKGKGYGVKDGSGTGVGPKDGTGYGAGRGAGVCGGTGVCDGTGPKGTPNRSGKK